MEFGKLESLDGVNWKLPPEDPGNFERFTSKNEFDLFLGSPAWANTKWKGSFYPEELSPDQFLHHYSRQFNCTEFNTTHYRIPTPEQTKKWTSQVPGNFKFCPKVTKEISHSRFGMMDLNLLKLWTTFLEQMGNNLGPCFIQFHEKFSYEEKMILFNFLKNWPDDFKLALEFRHPSWFKDHTIIPGLTDYLHKRGMGLVITDVAGRRDVLHTSVASSWSMIRLIGNDLALSDEQRLKDWGEKIQSWKNNGLKEAYLFLHQPDDNFTIQFSQMGSKILNNQFELNAPKIESIEERNIFNF